MSVTEIRGITDVAHDLAGDLAVADEHLEMVRHTALSAGTRLVPVHMVQCQSMEEVDSAAAQWSLAPHWNHDSTQYLAEHGPWQRQLVFTWIPLGADPAPGEDGPAWPSSATVTEVPRGSIAEVDKLAATWAAEGRTVTTGWEGDARYAARTVDEGGNVQCAFWRFSGDTEASGSAA